MKIVKSLNHSLFSDKISAKFKYLEREKILFPFKATEIPKKIEGKSLKIATKVKDTLSAEKFNKKAYEEIVDSFKAVDNPAVIINFLKKLLEKGKAIKLAENYEFLHIVAKGGNFKNIYNSASKFKLAKFKRMPNGDLRLSVKTDSENKKYKDYLFVWEAENDNYVYTNTAKKTFPQR